jgi:hypothetical protein
VSRLRAVAGALLDLAARRIPDVKPIIFDWPPEREQAANLRAELATRGEVKAGRIEWEDEPVPYIPTGRTTK